MGDKILVTGGCGFIGSNFIRNIVSETSNEIVNLDVLTYAGNLENLKDLEERVNYTFIKGDICDKKLVSDVMSDCNMVVHFAAESHVDRSITGPEIFTKTNVLGTNVLLECAKENNINKFIYMSTDEVYGSVMEGSSKENDRMNPSSPYSASKAAADLLVKAYNITYNLPTVILRSSNNFGPYQHPEKLIPHFTSNLLENKKVTIYGTGKNIRDWIYVDDACHAIEFLMKNGKNGEAYNVGGGNEKTNLEITNILLKKLGKNESFIAYVKDRPGHDFRYSLDSSKLHNLGWKQKHDFEDAIDYTISWYKDNEQWWKKLKG